MPYFEHYPDKTISSLSARLSTFAESERTPKDDERYRINRENAKLNLASVLAQLILKINFPVLTKEIFKKIIEDYNAKNNTQLTIDDITDKNWIRFVNGEYLIPEVVRHSISLSLSDRSNSSDQEIPNELKDVFKVMQEVYKYLHVDNLYAISRMDLNEVLTKNPQVTEESLKKKNLLHFNTEKSKFELFSSSDYFRYLTDEIVMELWQLIMEPHQTIENFRHFLKVLMLGPVTWSGNFLRFTDKQALQIFHELAFKFLSEEKDLEYSDKEMEKVYLDSPHFSHNNIFDVVPNIHITASDAYGVIKELRAVGWNYSDLFIHQHTRRVYSLVCHLIIEHPISYIDPYSPLLRLLKLKNRPYLIYIIHFDIKKKHPELIPYLMSDGELAPLFFYMIEVIAISEKILKEQGYEERLKEKEEIRSALWLEALSHVLSLIAKHAEKDNTYIHSVSKILLDLAREVFSFNVNYYNYNVIRHNVLRKRYDVALKLLAEVQIDYVNTYPVPKVKPRLFISILPTLFKALNDSPVYPARNEFIHIDASRVDLATEFLKITNIKLFKYEATEDQITQIETLKSEITIYLFKEIKNYFTATSIQVNSYSVKPEERKVKRGVSDFALEIIDWAFIYAHFYKYALLDKLDSEFRNSISIEANAEDSIYSQKNQEEIQKIRPYIKFLILAQIGVTKNKTQLELLGFDVIELLKKLEDKIIYYSLQYSINKLEENKINVFRDSSTFFDGNFYNQALSSMLFVAVNNFAVKKKKSFISDFLSQNNDLSTMLEARNKIDGTDIKKIISDKISAINVDSYIESRFHLSELEDALIESINSETHFDIATSVLHRIEQHMEKVKMNTEQSRNFIYRIKLLLAFKQKNIEELKNIPVPKPDSTFSKIGSENERRKAFYIALHKLYNENNYEEAINSLEALHSQENKNVDFAFHLYRAKTLNAIKS